MKIYVALKSLCFVYEKGEFTFGRGGLGQYRWSWKELKPAKFSGPYIWCKWELTLFDTHCRAFQYEKAINEAIAFEA